MAPPVDFIERVFLPAMTKMGAMAELRMIETGFAPVGGGVIECEVQACAKFDQIEWMERGELREKSIRVPVRDLPMSIAGRVLDAALAAFPCEEAKVVALPEGPGRGVACFVEASFEHGHELCATFGEHGTSSEKVGRRAAKMMNDFIGNGAAVGRHLADQLLLPMALAGGGRFTTMPPDSHVPTNIAVIEKFLPVKFEMRKGEGGVCEVSLRSRDSCAD